MEDFRDTSHMLFSKLDEYVPQDAISPVANTQHVLAKLSKPTPGAEKTSKLLVNSKILQVRGALAADIASKPPTKTIEILGPDGSPISKIEIGGTPARGGLPYFALKELRSRIGEMIGDSRLTSEIPRRQLKALYGAITDDMKATVQIYGGEDGMRAFNRANHYVKAGHERIDSVLQPVADQNLPERIFSAAASGTRQGDSTIHAVMQSLPAKQQRVVSAAVLRMMGVAPPSAQTAEGELFSVSRFLTNWAAMSPEAKRSLFSRFGSGYVENLNKIAKVAQDIRQGGEVYANPSGTAPVFFLQSTIGGAVIAMMMGHLGIAGTIVGENIFSRIVAQKILNPSFGDWLAKYATLPIAALPVALNQLSQSREQGRDGQEKKSTPSVSGDPRYRINSAPVPNPYPAIPTPGNEGVRG
ncbi:MAG: hypothetical protein ACRD52_00665 [Candidatus Acidiferrales bacterium]